MGARRHGVFPRLGPHGRGQQRRDRAGARHQALRSDRSRRRCVAIHRRRRVLLAPRPERLRQDDDSPHDRRLRAAGRRPDPSPGRRRDHRPAEPPAAQHGLPALRALPAHVDLRQRRIRAEGLARSALRPPRADRQDAPRRRARGLREAAHPPALRRATAAGRARAGAREGAGRAAARRAARRARREAPQADAARAEADPGRARDDVRLRDARPGRGARDVRPDRRHERGPRRADRKPTRNLRTSRDAVRRRLHRVAEHARPAGGRAGRQLRDDAGGGGRAAHRPDRGRRQAGRLATDRRPPRAGTDRPTRRNPSRTADLA